MSKKRKIRESSFRDLWILTILDNPPTRGSTWVKVKTEEGPQSMTHQQRVLVSDFVPGFIDVASEVRPKAQKCKSAKGFLRARLSNWFFIALVLAPQGKEVHSLTSIILSSTEKDEEAACCISLSTSLIASKRLRACNRIRVKNVDSLSTYQQGSLRCLRLLLYRQEAWMDAIKALSLAPSHRGHES